MNRFFYILFAMLLVLGWSGAAEASAFGDKVSNMAEIKAVRVGASAEYVRIVVDASKEVKYKTMVLSGPDRVVVDIAGAWLSPNVARDIKLDSRFASRIRVGQFDKTTVRVVVETTVTKGNYDVFTIEGGENAAPYRVVMDFGRTGDGSAKDHGTTDQPKAAPTDTPKEDGNTAKEPEKETAAEKKTAKPENPEDVKAAEEANQEAKKSAEETEKSADEKDKKDKKADSEKSSEDKKKDAKSEDKKNESGTKEKEKEEKPIPEPKFSPGIKGKKIAIDPGHGGEDSGAIGPTGITEKSVTLRIAKEVQALLKKAGAVVIMTRETDTEVSPKHRQATDIDELQARCDVANKAKADIFVSIHTDSFTSREASGTTGYYYEKGTAASRRLAQAIQSVLYKQLKTTSRGVKTCNFYVVRKTNMPATLIEVAFLSNPKEEKLLNSKQGVTKSAVAIVQGISDFFGK